MMPYVVEEARSRLVQLDDASTHQRRGVGVEVGKRDFMGTPPAS
jgi:hypothetical protein